MWATGLVLRDIGVLLICINHRESYCGVISLYVVRFILFYLIINFHHNSVLNITLYIIIYVYIAVIVMTRT